MQRKGSLGEEDLTSSRTHHQDVVDHLLHGAQGLLPDNGAVGAPQGDDSPLPVTFQVGPFLHDLAHLRGKKSRFSGVSLKLLTPPSL